MCSLLSLHVLPTPQESLQQNDHLAGEEVAMTMAGRRHENKKRNLEQAVQGKQESLQARHRQGEAQAGWGTGRVGHRQGGAQAQAQAG